MDIRREETKVDLGHKIRIRAEKNVDSWGEGGQRERERLRERLRERERVCYSGILKSLSWWEALGAN